MSRQPHRPESNLFPGVVVIAVIGLFMSLAAARQGRTVTLVEPRPFLGTVLTGAMLNIFDLDRGRHGVSTVQGLFAEVYDDLGLTFDPRAAAGSRTIPRWDGATFEGG